MKILKRSFCFMAAIAVFICSFAFPIAAFDFSDGSSRFTFSPIYNLDHVKVTYNDGSEAIFDIPSHFFDSFPLDDYDSNTITLYDYIDSEKPPRTLTFYDMFLSEPNYDTSTYHLTAFLDIDGFRTVEFVFIDSVLPYSALNQNFFGCSFFPSRVDDFISTRSIEVAYPYYRYDSYGNLTGKALKYTGISFADVSEDVIALPARFYDDVISLYPSSVSDYLIFVPEATATFQISDDYLSGDEYGLLQIGLIKDSQRVTFKDYYELYFGEYYVDGDVSFDFTGWIVTALGGFFGFEFIPGISLGTIFMFVFGIGAVFAFLRFFAGG